MAVNVWWRKGVRLDETRLHPCQTRCCTLQVRRGGASLQPSDAPQPGAAGKRAQPPAGKGSASGPPPKRVHSASLGQDWGDDEPVHTIIPDVEDSSEEGEEAGAGQGEEAMELGEPVPSPSAAVAAAARAAVYAALGSRRRSTVAPAAAAAAAAAEQELPARPSGAQTAEQAPGGARVFITHADDATFIPLGARLFFRPTGRPVEVRLLGDGTPTQGPAAP